MRWCSWGEEGSRFTVQFSLHVGSIFIRLADTANYLWSCGVAVDSQAETYLRVSQKVQDASA